MSLLRLLAIGTLLIALVHGQNDFDTDDTGDPEQSKFFYNFYLLSRK